MRTRQDVFSEGRLMDGYDYNRQAWVRGGRYVRCAHPEAMACGCYGRDHAGEETDSASWAFPANEDAIGAHLTKTEQQA